MVEKEYHTLVWRVAAVVVDFLLLIPVGMLAEWLQGSARSGIKALVFGLVPIWAFIVYRVLMHSYKGQTVGKMTTRLKVYDLSRQPLSMKQAILRETVLILIGLFALISYAAHLANRDLATSASPAWGLDITRITFA